MSDETFLSWHRRVYGDAHRDRGNLAIHLATWPLFVGGLVATIVAAPLGVYWLLAAGPAAMVVAIAAQGRGHRREAIAPPPFRGPADVLKRLFAEQLITFPRFVFSGEAFRAGSAQNGSSTRRAG